MKTDKQIHALLASTPEAFRFLTDGIELHGSLSRLLRSLKNMRL
jgi:hypothetical protein